MFAALNPTLNHKKNQLFFLENDGSRWRYTWFKSSQQKLQLKSTCSCIFISYFCCSLVVLENGNFPFKIKHFNWNPNPVGIPCRVNMTRQS